MTGADAVELRWLNWNRDPDFEDEPVMSCYLSKVFDCWSRRNTYGGQETTRTGLYALDPGSLKTRIEEKRTQGTEFFIVETPVMVLMGSKYDVLLFELGGNPTFKSGWHPFKDIAIEKVAGKTLKTLAKSINAYMPLSLKSFLVPSGQTVIPVFPFSCQASFVRGSGLSLGWASKRKEVDIGDVMKLITQCCLQLQAGENAAQS